MTALGTCLETWATRPNLAMRVLLFTAATVDSHAQMV